MYLESTREVSVFLYGRREGGDRRFEDGGVRIFSFEDMANFWFGFSVFAFKNCGISVFALKTAFFRFWCLARFAGFLQFSCGFSVFVNTAGKFSLFLFNAFYGFFGFAEKVTRCSRAKTVIPRHHSYSVLTLSFSGMHDKPSLFSSRCLGRNGC